MLDSRGEIDTIVALQLPTEAMNEIMNIRAGMGETGETYLVGPDQRMRCDSFLDPKDHSMAASFAGTVKNNGVNTEAYQEAMAGKSDATVITHYDGDPVLSAYAPVSVFDTQWALLAEIEKDEAFLPVMEMQISNSAAKSGLTETRAIIMAVAVVAIAGVAIAIALSITRPLRKAVDFALTVANGNLTKRVEINQSDEIGDLARALNDMAGNLQEMVRNLGSNAQTLSHSSSELSATATQLAGGAEETTSQSGLRGRRGGRDVDQHEQHRRLDRRDDGQRQDGGFVRGGDDGQYHRNRQEHRTGLQRSRKCRPSGEFEQRQHRPTRCRCRRDR